MLLDRQRSAHTDQATDGEPMNLSYQPRVLIAEDNEQTAQQLRSLLEGSLGVLVDIADDGKEALEALKRNFYSLFLTDLKMPRLDGMELIQQIEELKMPVTIVVMTGHPSVENAVEAMRRGAYDFLTKPLNVDHLELVIRRALQERALRDELVYLREQLQMRETFRNIITKSPHMLSVLELVNHIGHTSTTVLIEGETGTGKELDRPRHPSGVVQPAARPAHRRELCSSTGEPFGERAVWTRKGGFHRSDLAAQRTLRASPRGHALPG